MLFKGGNEDAKIARARILSSVANIEDLTLSDRHSVAYDYWYGRITDLAEEEDFEASYHRLRLAGEGKNAFSGPDSIMRGHVEGEPFDLLCNDYGIMRLSHMLYNAMLSANAIHVNMIKTPSRPWGRMFPSGSALAVLLDRPDDHQFELARLYVLEIAASVYVHRKFAQAA